MSSSRKLVTLSLRDFALPVPRTGSLEIHSARSTAEGQEIHQRVQRKRGKADPLYRSEVPVGCTLERGGYRFRIEGRMDGLFLRDPPKIEEIKSGATIFELARRLADDPMGHPYGLQLLTYGYFYWREHQVLPLLSFHFVSSRNGDSRDVALSMDLACYEKWLDARLDELVVEAKKAQRRAVRRRKVAASFPFPFVAPRPGQSDLMEEVEAGISEGRPMLIQAPTGLGKTVGVLYPMLKEALSRGQRVVYVTPKNSQHAVAEDAVSRFQRAGARLKPLSVTAKGKICFKDEPLCAPETCEYARDYYGKVVAHGVLEELSKKRRLTARTFRKWGERFEVCPFELQIDCAPEADILICDYNYVFAPRSALGRVSDLGLDQDGKANLVVDEFHNLPSRAMDTYSPSLSCLALEAMREEIRSLPARFRSAAESLLDGCIEVVESCRPAKISAPARIAPPAKAFLDQDRRLRAFLSRYLESDVEIGARDVVLRLSFYWSEFTESLVCASDPERQEFFTTYHPHPSGGSVKITCCDASALLRDCYPQYEQVVGFSATLKPFDYFVRLSGLDPERVRTAEFESPFPPARRKLLAIPQISTRYAHRERNYAKIAEAIARISALRQGNYLVFLPSFDFLEKVMELFRAPEGFAVLRQERSMKGSEIEAVLERLRTPGDPAIVFAVQGGSFSEGVDYAGDMVIGAFVIGPPLPSYNLEREEMKGYYQRRYGAGFEYAYVVPAMAKAVQAAGRVIRSETDRGLIVLMDSRFVELEYTRSMPADWFESDVTELVSDSILGDVADFWAT